MRTEPRGMRTVLQIFTGFVGAGATFVGAGAGFVGTGAAFVGTGAGCVGTGAAFVGMGAGFVGTAVGCGNTGDVKAVLLLAKTLLKPDRSALSGSMPSVKTNRPTNINFFPIRRLLSRANFEDGRTKPRASNPGKHSCLPVN